MKEKYIAVIDSGIGGTTILTRLKDSLKGFNIIYYGDNLNAPYGNKRPEELLSLTLLNIVSAFNTALKAAPFAVVLACNTLSVSVRSELESVLKVPIFGVFPPVEKYSNQKTLLLATPVTAEQYKPSKNLTVIPMFRLAAEIERNAFSLERVNIANHLPMSKAFCSSFDNVILGCTHYELLKNKFIDHFCPAKIVCPTDFTVNYVSEKLKNSKSPVIHSENKVMFIGNFSKINKKFYKSVVVNAKKIPKKF